MASSNQDKRGYFSTQERSATFMFYPSLWVFVYASLEKDYAMALLCCLDWVTSKEGR